MLRPSPPNPSSALLAACVVACGPQPSDPREDTDPETVGTSTTDVRDTSSTTSSPPDPSTSDSTSTGPQGSSSSTGEPPLGCGGDLSEQWRVADTDRARGESVSIGDGRVAWVATALGTSTRTRAHDLDGNELWSADAQTSSGEGALRLHGIAAGPVTVFVGTDWVTDTAQMMGYDLEGQLVFSDPMLAGVVDAGGVAIGSDGAILFGGSDLDLQLRLYDDAGGLLASDAYDHGGDEHVFDVAADGAGGYFAASHSNLTGRPLLARVDATGTVEWVVEPSGTGSQTAHGVASDGAAGAWLAVAGSRGSDGFLEHFDARGNHLETLPLPFDAQQVGVDADGNLVVLGRNFPSEPILVRRLDPSGDLLAEASLPGQWGLDLELDGDCHVYVVGSDPTGAYLVKLD